LHVRLAVGILAASLACTGTAGASSIVSDRNVKDPTLEVNAAGTALVQYTTQAGLRRHVLFWGAVNAAPNPSAGGAQQTFRIDYSGGWKSRHDARYWRSFRNVCRPYSGPQLPFFVTGCTAPDGSFWALQSWQRNLPMRGFAPWTPQQSGYELHVSHWSGELPQLEVYRHWTYGNAHQGFFGRLTYDGQPVYGTRSPSASVSDEWARNVYIDTFDSDYGPGWRHDTAITTHPGSGGFCYSFVPQPPPSGYPSDRPHGTGLGTRYRISAMGPGVTPIVQWVGARLTRFSAAAQAAATQKFDQILGGDRHCAPER
jgi:hypothetical protein